MQVQLHKERDRQNSEAYDKGMQRRGGYQAPEIPVAVHPRAGQDRCLHAKAKPHQVPLKEAIECKLTGITEVQEILGESTAASGMFSSVLFQGLYYST
jgi:hypothetical protein